MVLKKYFLILLLSLLPLSAVGAEVELFKVTTREALQPLIVPVRKNETVSEALQNHYKSLQKDPGLTELFSGRTPHLTVTHSEKLSLDASREARVLLIANLPKDYTKDSQRVKNFANIFRAKKQNSFILPVAAAHHFSAQDQAAFHQAIVEHFPMMVAMGGDDVATELYQRQDFHARNTISSRDRAEISLIQAYTKAQKGFLLGVCRGSQLTAVSLGYKLIQDVPFHIGETVAHANDWHEIRLRKTTHNILATTPGTQNNKLFVNSLHHQAVAFKPGGPLELAAIGADGVTEATEFKNGKGLLLQFHPELMNNKLGSEILFKTLAQKQKVAAPLCNSVF